MGDSKPSVKPTASFAVAQTQIARVKILAEVAGAVALSGALNLVRVFTFPEGGSITLAAMTPVILLALRRGMKAGTIAGVIFGLVVLIEEPFVVHPIQLLLDYPVAFGALGLAGLFQRKHWERLIQSRPSLAKLTRETNFMVGLLVVYIIADFLLTPLGGLETRPVSKVTSVGIATLGLLFAGLTLNITCLILTLRHYKRSPIFGIVGSILYFPAAIADQTGQFSILSPPAGIAYVEVIEAIVAIGIIILGAQILRNKHVSMNSVLPIIGVVVAISARFLSHFVSGIVYFASYAPSDQGPILYSALYNASYLVPEMIITAVVISILVRFKVLDLYR